MLTLITAYTRILLSCGAVEPCASQALYSSYFYVMNWF